MDFWFVFFVVLDSIYPLLLGGASLGAAVGLLTTNFDGGVILRPIFGEVLKEALVELKRELRLTESVRPSVRAIWRELELGLD